MTSPTLRLEGVTYQVAAGPDAARLVSNLELAIPSQQLTIMLGPNGSGKTTTLRLLAGLLEPTNGRVRLGEESLTEMASSRPRELARRMAYVPQNLHTVFDFTVEQLVGMARFPHRGRLERWRERDHQRVDAAIARLHLGALRHRLARTLSGGELQRVQLARCLAGDAEVLLLDEPTANLDLASSLEVLQICRELASEGRLVLITMHDLSAARRFADRIVLLHQGGLVASGIPSVVLDGDNIRRVFGVQATLLGQGNESAYWFDTIPS